MNAGRSRPDEPTHRRARPGRPGLRTASLVAASLLSIGAAACGNGEVEREVVTAPTRADLRGSARTTPVVTAPNGATTTVLPGLPSTIAAGPTTTAAGPWTTTLPTAVVNPGTVSLWPPATGTGDDDWLVTTGSAPATASTTTSPPATTVPAGPVELRTRTVAGRPVLTDRTDRSLYVFAAERNGTPACVDACALSWEPVLGSVDTIGPGVDPTLVGTTTRPDGSRQVTYNRRPLYRLAGEAPGATSGHGRDGSWFLLTASGAELPV